MPDVGLLRTLVRTLRRWSVCRLVDGEPDDPQPFRILVRPAIVDIVGAQWLQRLDQHNDQAAGDEDGRGGGVDDDAMEMDSMDMDTTEETSTAPAGTEGAHVPA